MTVSKFSAHDDGGPRSDNCTLCVLISCSTIKITANFSGPLQHHTFFLSPYGHGWVGFDEMCNQYVSEGLT